jgi:TrmH family RNA methyltransferase
LYSRLAYGDRSDGVVATAPIPARPLANLRLPSSPLVMILVEPEKPGNVGAVMRSADAAGWDAVVLADAVCDPWHPNTIRASMGSAFSIALAVGTSDEVIAWVRAAGWRLRGARVGAATRYWDVDWIGGAVVAMGNEAAGLDERWSAETAEPIGIPMAGRADSLNLSVSAALIMFEARRQRAAMRGAAGSQITPSPRPSPP